uniref:CUB domain-containing protein n=1 Tax=Heterorhabditis bacteriophora TaxID=37862 RepID=A0A1I7WT86_HETBA
MEAKKAMLHQLLLENSEAVVLNVSPAFSTSYNGVQFTWALRLSDECVVVSSGEVFSLLNWHPLNHSQHAFYSAEAAPSVRHVFVLLYYKDGPSSDVIVEEKCGVTCLHGAIVSIKKKAPVQSAKKLVFYYWEDNHVELKKNNKKKVIEQLL